MTPKPNAARFTSAYDASRGEFVPIALVFVAGVLSALLALGSWDGLRCTMGVEFYIPAIVWAHGGGLHDITGEFELMEFLTGGQDAWGAERFDAAALSETNAHTFLHRYLMLAMGIWMRVFGVTAESLQLLTAVAVGLSATLVYGLFRILMGRPLSALGALIFLAAPAVTDDLPNFRDFAKTPFMLGILLLIAVLLAKRPQAWKLLFAAGALALIAGIGFGFRRDTLLYLPAALLALAVPLRSGGWRLWGWHAAAAALCAGVFAAAALPIFRTMSESGSLGYHDILTGLAAPRAHAIGLEPANYTRMYYQWDTLAHAAAEAYGQETGKAAHPAYIYSEASRQLKRGMLLDLLATFPSDFIGRGLAGVARILTGDPAWADWWGAPKYPEHILGPILEGYAKAARVISPAMAIVVFAFLAATRPRTALFAAAVMILGQISLQYETRHVIQLTFVHTLLTLYLLHAMWTCASRACRLGWRGRVPDFQVSTRAVTWGGAAAGAALAMVLGGAMLLQELRVRSMASAFAAMTSTEMSAHPVELDEMVLFVPESRPYVRRFLPAAVVEWQRTYYRITLAADEEPFDLWMMNESGNGTEPLHARIVLPPHLGEGELVHLFFPGFESMSRTEWARFSGVMVRAEDAERVQGMARMAGGPAMPLSPCFVLPASAPSTPMRYRQQVSLLQRPRTYPYGDLPDYGRPHPGHWQISGSHEERIATLMNYLEANPLSRRWALMKAQYHMLAGEHADGLAAHEHTLLHHPHDVTMYEAANTWYTQLLSPEEHAERWRAWTERTPENAFTWFFLALTLHDRLQDIEGARGAFAKAYALGCEDERVLLYYANEIAPRLEASSPEAE